MLEEAIEAIRQRLKEMDEASVHIALFGQPGSGKSSLINALLGQEVAEVKPSTDTTISRADYEKREDHNWNGLFLTDLPGYGTAKFPASTYFADFNIDSFDFFLCVTSGKLHDSDELFFKRLIKSNKHCFFVRNKVDSLKQRGKTTAELQDEVVDDFRKQIGEDINVFFTNCIDNVGIDELSAAIARALPEVKEDRFLRSATAHSQLFLDKKRAACRKYALYSAALSATANVVPIPGVGFGADMLNLTRSMKKIRTDFQLTEMRMDKYVDFIPGAAPFIGKLIESASREGAIRLLQQAAKSGMIVETSKYLPFVGALIAGSVGFSTIMFVLNTYINDCYKVADEMLKNEFK